MRRKQGGISVTSISYRDTQQPVLDELDVIAAREKKSKSELIMDLIAEYVKNHSAGNPEFKLDNWQYNPGFEAVPAFFSDPLKWRKHYTDSNKDSRTKIKVQLNQLSKQVNNVDFNEQAQNKRR